MGRNPKCFLQNDQTIYFKWKYAEALKKYKAIAAGFVDGDLEILYQR